MEATNQDGTPHAIPVFGRVNLLFLWSRDGTDNFGLFFNARPQIQDQAIYSGRIGVIVKLRPPKARLPGSFLSTRFRVGTSDLINMAATKTLVQITTFLDDTMLEHR